MLTDTLPALQTEVADLTYRMRELGLATKGLRHICSEVNAYFRYQPAGTEGLAAFVEGIIEGKAEILRSNLSILCHLCIAEKLSAQRHRQTFAKLCAQYPHDRAATACNAVELGEIAKTVSLYGPNDVFTCCCVSRAWMERWTQNDVIMRHFVIDNMVREITSEIIRLINESEIGAGLPRITDRDVPEMTIDHLKGAFERYMRATLDDCNLCAQRTNGARITVEDVTIAQTIQAELRGSDRLQQGGLGLYLVAQDDCLAYKGPFFRLVREMHNGLAWDRSFPSQALGRLKTVCESYLIRLFIDARMCAVHAMRMTIFPKDISLVLRIRQEKDDFDPMFHRPSASRSRREKFQSILEDVVMDVGAGSGISSFFAAQAGASNL